MKKIFIAGMAFAAMLFSVSCQHGLDNQLPDGTMVDVTFAVDIQGAELFTRAISDGTGANQLMWAIFNEEGALIHSQTVKDNVKDLLSENGHTISMSLAKGKTYKAVFWAQNAECTAYEVSDDMKVTINYEGINNDETRDAFFASSDPFSADGTSVVSVVLKRPFAQINVGAFPWDLQYAKESGMDVQMSGATIKNVPDVINLFDGSVEGDAEVNYSLAATPQEVLSVDVDENGEKETYEYLSMSYILATAEGATHEMAFTFSDAQGGGAYTFSSGLGAVPAKRNWRTNIVGQILTGDISINIKIDPAYEGETINSGGLYYNFTDDTKIENKSFAFNTEEAATFTSENNNVVTMTDVEFSGRVQYIAMGEYRDKGNYVDFTNVMTNVKAVDVVVDHPGICCVETIDYMAPLVFLRGVSTLENCTFTGATTTATTKKDYNGTENPVLPYDCGVPNACDATFNNCTVDRLFAWSHSHVTINNSTFKYIRCATHPHSNPSSHLTIGEGSVIDEIFVTSSGTNGFKTIDGKKTLIVNNPTWSPALIIKSGARVKRLDMNGRSFYEWDSDGNKVKATVIIEDGATVDEIVNTIDELE